MKSEKCDTCKFFLPFHNPEDVGMGVCRRFPPSIVVSGGGNLYRDGLPREGLMKPLTPHSDYPLMQAESWCGEWKEIP